MAEITDRCLEAAAKRCAKALGRELVMQKYECDGCGVAVEQGTASLLGDVKIRQKKHSAQLLLYVDGKGDDLGDEPDICLACWKKVIDQLLGQQKK